MSENTKRLSSQIDSAVFIAHLIFKQLSASGGLRRLTPRQNISSASFGMTDYP